ncbi:MAG: hypothetical protein AAF565_10395 [Pseudomonadota bacterium]
MTADRRMGDGWARAMRVMGMGQSVDQGTQMRPAMAVSAAAHLGVIALAVLGRYGGDAPPTEAIELSDVSVVSEAEFFAATAAAPNVAPEVASGLPTPRASTAPVVAPDTTDPAVDVAEAEALGPTGPAARDAAERPAAVAVPPERPRAETVPDAVAPAAIAETAPPPPTATTPDQRPETEPVQPLAAAPAPSPDGTPEIPIVEERAPDPEPEAEAVADAALAPENAVVPKRRPTPPEPAQEVAEAPEREPEPAREDPAPTASEEDPAIAAALAAAEASIAQNAKPEPAAEEAEVARNGQGTSRAPAATAPTRAARVTQGEREALSLGIQQYFSYPGRREPGLVVTLEVRIDPTGKIVDGPSRVSASGGDAATQGALYQAARRALKKAEIAGEFGRFAHKLATYPAIQFNFRPDQVGFSS